MSVSFARPSLVRAVVLAALAALIVSCASAPKPIPDTLTPAELIQRAQDNTDRNKLDEAIRYYQTILDRYPTDLPSVCAAEYEIAFIRYKQGRAEEATQGFRTLLARYEGVDAELLPAHFRILGEKILAKIELEGKK